VYKAKFEVRQQLTLKVWLLTINAAVKV